MAIITLGRRITALEAAAPTVVTAADAVLKAGTALKDDTAPKASTATQAGNGATGGHGAIVAEAEAEPKVVASSKEGTSDTVATQPLPRYMAFGLACLAAGLGLGILLQYLFHPGFRHLPVLPASVGAFALLYVMAQSIERLLVPVSWFGGGFLGPVGEGGQWRDFASRSKASLAVKHQEAMAAAYRTPNKDTAQTAANSQHDLDQYRANLTATTFGLAAFAAMLVSGYAGVFLLHIVGLHTAAWLDILVTGLAIAGGTKPLHDLISNISAGGKAKK
jgi:hypothetical protein